MFIKFLDNPTIMIASAGLVLTFCYSILWKDVVNPRWRKRKGWKSLEIHPLYYRELDTPSGQEWIVGGFVMTSNNREFLTEFFLEDTRRVDDALQSPVVSPHVKPNSVVIGYKLTHYPDCPQNRSHLIPKYGTGYGYQPWWELAVSKCADDWKTRLKDRQVNIVTEGYEGFLPTEPSTKELKHEKKSFIKEWKDRCSGKSDE